MSSSVKTNECDKANSGPPQEDYCPRSDKHMNEHQKPSATACDLSSSSQSSATPKQQA